MHEREKKAHDKDCLCIVAEPLLKKPPEIGFFGEGDTEKLKKEETCVRNGKWLSCL